jgi:hypothetical protein
MTTKEIAEAVGKDERTVQRWIKRAGDKMSSVADKMSAAGHGKSADYTLEETIAIIEAGMGKNAAGVFRANAEKPASDATSLTAIIRETITAMVPILVEVVRGVLPQQQIATLPAPAELSLRDQLRRVINGYAQRSGDHAGAWRELYTQFYYRYHRNLRECAKNQGVDTLDYVENEGIMDELLSLAISLYGNHRQTGLISNSP